MMATSMHPRQAATTDKFQVRFWGVRGSIACPGVGTLRYGGNTPCVEMRVAGQTLIFDAGTGIRALGVELAGQNSVSGHLFFSHSHWDHIQGFPFFAPAFAAGNRFDIYGGIAPNGTTIEERLHNQMMDPNFPVPLNIMSAELQFHNLEVNKVIEIGDVRVANASLNHPGGAYGYRVSWQDLAVAYVTDTEHEVDRLDENVLALARDTDLFIYDCTYTEEEYHHPTNSKVGWGHSTWQQGVKLAIAAGAKELVIFHHDPSHDDEFMDEVGQAATQVFPNTTIAREGEVRELSSSLKAVS
jgi:phosphoribosyl 1,2-cyclic phosphodiesterase